MKRARYLVFFELIFVGLLCLATFLFALFALSASTEGVGIAATLLSFVQIGLAVVTLLVTHFTLRTVFRRGAVFDNATIADSPPFRLVPVVIVALGLFHILLLQVSPPGMREFGMAFTRDRMIYIFGLALFWHIATARLLRRPMPAEESEPSV